MKILSRAAFPILKESLSSLYGFGIFVATAIIFFSASVLVQSYRIVGDILFYPISPLYQQYKYLLFQVLYSYETLGLFSYTVLWVITFILAANLAIAFHLSRAGIKVNWGRSGGAALFGAFALGCFACGASISGSVLIALGLAGVLALLPWKGDELLVIALILSVYSFVSLLNAAAKRTCAVSASKPA